MRLSKISKSQFRVVHCRLTRLCKRNNLQVTCSSRVQGAWQLVTGRERISQVVLSERDVSGKHAGREYIRWLNGETCCWRGPIHPHVSKSRKQASRRIARMSIALAFALAGGRACGYYKSRGPAAPIGFDERKAARHSDNKRCTVAPPTGRCTKIHFKTILLCCGRNDVIIYNARCRPSWRRWLRVGFASVNQFGLFRYLQNTTLWAPGRDKWADLCSLIGYDTVR
jgi:hypothetical protein